jgi:dephospho-CoA kinase
VVIDADRIAREVVAPGMPGLAEITARFGEQVLLADGSLNRPALGAIVFADHVARRELEAITHPLVRESTERRRAAAPREAIVVHDVPLLVEADLAPDHHLAVIVDAAEHVRRDRLVRDRGMRAEEAAARIAAQATDEQRYAAADVLLDNNGTRDALLHQVETLWRERLSPYNDNLLAGRGAGSVQGSDVQPGTRAADRTLARLSRQLDRAGFGGRVVGMRFGAAGALTLTLRGVPPDDGTLRRALLAAGFAAGSGSSGFASCDPAVPLRLEVRNG